MLGNNVQQWLISNAHGSYPILKILVISIGEVSLILYLYN